jgi:hypothetical protein
MSRVQIAADKPYLVALAELMACSIPSTRSKPMTGLKLLAATKWSGRTSTGIVGAKKWPWVEVTLVGIDPPVPPSPLEAPSRPADSCRHRRTVDQGTHRHAFRLGSPGPDGMPCQHRNLLDELVVNSRIDQDPAGTGARLAGQREARSGDDRCSSIEVGIGEHYDRVLASELELNSPSDPDRGMDLASGGVGTGERRRRPHRRKRDGHRQSPVDDIDHAWRKPASTNAAASRSPISGVIGEGLKTTVLPAASAGPILRLARLSGKFHGVITATTPTGSRVL